MSLTKVTYSMIRGAVANVLDFGAVGDGASTDADTAAFLAAIAALPATGGPIEVPDAPEYKIKTSLYSLKPVLWKIGNTTISTDGLTGYLFNLGANNSGIEGTAQTILKANTGCTALVFNDQAMRTHYWNFNVELNSVANCTGIYHNGGWYVSVKNVWSDIANSPEVASSYLLQVISTYTGVAGSTGSYGGAYVSTYDNLIGGKININATIPQLTTTLTFTGCSLSNVYAENARALTFLQPIIQGAGNFFDLTNVAGLTCLGGDFEVNAGGQVYVFQGGDNRDIVSIGNQTSGVTAANYIIGAPSAGCTFVDSGITGTEDEMLRYGSLPEYALRNNGFTSKMRLGIPYGGDILVAANNLKLLSSTQGNLDDVSANGSAIVLDQSGQVIVYLALAAANPVTLIKSATFNYASITMPVLQSSAPAGGSKGLWYDPADGNRVKFVP